MSSLKNQRTLQRFLPQKNQISELKRNNYRFKRVFREYEMMSEQLWNLETSSEISVSDDFLNAVSMQTNILEEEIQNWLHPQIENNPI
ncbi:hypothetical protein SAMN05421847_1496 [Halpernia humi]|uniref:Uncharacterized protein n=1 Tax=Halpernia humi TaxID=493375 RepID=A0A1H5XPV2_9FLAO|nr:hypothetical protein [Halpernia humi]SEG13286.1 hypothetical protein SAMN05421847_1496 [Halpernia humi]